RDLIVTGVKTCALPISGASYASDPENPGGTSSFDKGAGLADARLAVLRTLGLPDDTGVTSQITIDSPVDGSTVAPMFTASGTAEIGRASCRERGGLGVV